MPAKPMTDVEFIAVHCSATKAGQHFDAKDIDRWHRDRGWRGIGYHFVITLAGEVQKGRPVTEPGAHVAGYNSKAIGICLIGGLDENGKSANTYTDSQFAALAELVIDLRKQFPKATVQGHRDFPNVHKDCPCFDVRTWLKETVDVTE